MSDRPNIKPDARELVTSALGWTEHAANQIGAIAEYISLMFPVYAEQVDERVVLRLTQRPVHVAAISLHSF